MAKAKVLSERYRESNFHIDTLTDIMVEIYSEIPKLIEQRKLGQHSGKAVLAVFSQVEQKYKAFGNRVNEHDCQHQVNVDGFYTLMEKVTPDIYDAYINLKAAV